MSVSAREPGNPVMSGFVEGYRERRITCCVGCCLAVHWPVRVCSSQA